MTPVFRAVNPVGSTEGARLREREQEQAVQLAVISKVSRLTASILDMDQLSQEVVTAIQQDLNYHNVMLAMLDETASELEVTAIAGGFADLVSPDYRQAVGMGMIGWTAEVGQPLVANDVSQEPRYILGFLEEPLTKAELCVPLKLANQVIGVLDVQDTRLNVFDETDLLAVETLADQLAVAIERARLYQEIQRRLEELTFLSRVGRTVTSSLDLEQILTMVMKETALVLGAEIGSVLLLDEENGELVFEAAVGPRAEGMKGLRLSLDQGIAGWVAREGQPLLVPDVREDPRFYPGTDEITGFVTKSVLAVPLKVKGKVIGVIEALNKAGGDFSQADVALLSSMAQTAAIAIENAQFYEELKQEHERLQQAQEQMLAAERWAVLGKAAANLAHRINNTAGLIPVVAQDLKELLADVALVEERRQEIDADLQRVERNTRFTLQMADALFKPFEALPTEECDVNALLEESASVAQVPENVALKTECADELPKVIASRRLADVFVELITNAVQAMPDGGELEIGSRLGKEGWVEVWFSDTGYGIPPANQDRIFDLFFTTSEDSLGFGLWWVKTFLEQQGATIDMQSEVGKSTTFTVRLPVKGP
jgi:GAF domain-containing protein